MKISILVVSLNAGDALLATVNSILKQKNAEFEVVVKDGGSTDGSIAQLPQDERMRIYINQDTGIYDAMNQAIQYAQGEYAMYLNCGDVFYNDTVLADVTEVLKADVASSQKKRVYYGDCYTVNRDYILRYPDVFDDYVCFTKVLCHQATVYPTSLLKSRAFATEYKIAADYEYYVYAYKNGYQLVHIPVVIARYEGNGASETTKNRRLALNERKRALKRYFLRKDYQKTWWKTQLHGAGIKHMLLCVDWFYPIYQKIAEKYYAHDRQGGGNNST